MIGVAFFSATQDICIDALRIEMVEERELGQSAAVYQMGWRVGGVWISQVLGLLIGGIIGYSYAYTYVALIFLALSLFVFFFVQEPKREIRPYISLYDEPLTWIYDSFIYPILDLYDRYKKDLFLILSLIFIYIFEYYV